MGLAAYRQPASPRTEYLARFQENREKQKRYVLTFRHGEHLVGVPTAHSFESDSFQVLTSNATYPSIPFSELAFADELLDKPGRRPADGHTAIPEPCEPALSSRAKHEKFAILDAPSLVKQDIAELTANADATACPAMLYFDIDRFKEQNTRFHETRVDEYLLPQFIRLIETFVPKRAFAYQEGGDEFIVLFPNCRKSLALAFAESLRRIVEAAEFDVERETAKLTISIGVATAPTPAEITDLQRRAN